MTHEINPNVTPRQYAEQILGSSEAALASSVAIVSPETPDASPLEVFPAPNTVRSEDTGLELTPEQEAGLRQAAAELGFGREADRTISEMGFSGAHVIIEGGLPHKIMAEALMVKDDSLADPSTYIFAGSPHRKTTSDAEVASAEKQFDGKHGDTEFDSARLAAESIPGFVASEEDQILPFGYDLDADYALVAQASGQFTLIGHIDGTPVVLMKIDRENYTDEEGNAKYRNQPDSAAVIKIVSQVLSGNGDSDQPIAFVTSSTYQASREVDAAGVAVEIDRPIAVATYGSARLAATKGESAPAPAPINQLPGELHKLAQNVESLRKVLER